MGEAYLKAEAHVRTLRCDLRSEVDNYRAEALTQMALKNEFQMQRTSAIAARNELTQELMEQRRVAAADLAGATLRWAKDEFAKQHKSAEGETSCDATKK